jgi:hypothetical protein
LPNQRRQWRCHDFGQISGSLVKATTKRDLEPITQKWTVTCDALTYLSFTVFDNRSDTTLLPNVLTFFGLDNVHGTGKKRLLQCGDEQFHRGW